jgi:hypothetical protein
MFIQFVNGHNTDDGEPPWLIVIFLFFFSCVADDNKLPWLIITFLKKKSSVVDDGGPGGLSSFLS